MNKEIDQELLIRAKKDDQKAWDWLILEFQKPIYNHIYRLTSNKEISTDLTQDTFIKAYKNRLNIKLDGNFKSWLYKIATHTAYDWFKKVKRGGELFIIDDDDNKFETIEAEMTYYRVEDDYSDLDIKLAMEKLKPAQETILNLFYRQGFSYQEISDILSIPLNTTKTNLLRAKKAFKEALTKKDGSTTEPNKRSSGK